MSLKPTNIIKPITNSPNQQAGSAILIAIFVVIVISLLGASLTSLQRDSAQGTSFEVYAARAYLSAYTASEIALTELFPLSSSSSGDCSLVSAAPALPSDDIGFHQCTVSVTCSSITASAGIATRYKVVSTATCESSEIVSRRQITVEAAEL